jgi:glycine/D-amino acid oxidase-like deaminating enzyme
MCVKIRLVIYLRVVLQVMVAATLSSDTPCAVIICGGGVIGTAISYYLANKGVRSTVVDRCGLAAAASGRAGEALSTTKMSTRELYDTQERFLRTMKVRQHSL